MLDAFPGTVHFRVEAFTPPYLTQFPTANAKDGRNSHIPGPVPGPTPRDVYQSPLDEVDLSQKHRARLGRSDGSIGPPTPAARPTKGVGGPTSSMSGAGVSASAEGAGGLWLHGCHGGRSFQRGCTRARWFGRRFDIDSIPSIGTWRSWKTRMNHPFGVS